MKIKDPNETKWQLEMKQNKAAGFFLFRSLLEMVQETVDGDLATTFVVSGKPTILKT